MFRRERPQKGRFRQFYQFGVEIFGRADAACDAELLIMIDELCRDLKVPSRIEINSIGDQNCRPAFREALFEWGSAHWDELCEDCHNRMDRNPLRLLDCKTTRSSGVGASSPDYLCEDAARTSTPSRSCSLRADVQFVVNPRMVRGLDYYTRTTFEAMAEGLGAQSTVVAGGRYDGLVEAIGGAAVAGIGFGSASSGWRWRWKPPESLPAVAPDAAIIAMGAAAAASDRRGAQAARAN